MHNDAPRRLWLRSTLAARRAPWIGAAIAVVLTLPSMRAGWIVDDHFHRAVLTGWRDPRVQLPSKLDMFRFLDGDPDHNQALLDAGFLPWWADRQIRGAFWRPVTALTHWLDYQLWPRTPALMHLQSTLWYGALVLAVGLFYRRTFGPTWVAGLATILYAIDDAHGMPVGFIANRNTLIATFFGLVTLILHDRWRREGDKRAALLAAGVFVLSLLSSEAGLATTAYLFAYALFRDRGPRVRRVLSLAPYAAIVIVWRIAWTRLGYGVSAGMGLYIDPLTEPVAFITAALSRIPILLAGQLAIPPADASIVLDPGYVWVYSVAAAVIVAVIVMIAWSPLRRACDTAFWLTGMLLSLLPISATFPSDRLLGFVGIGAMALIARFFEVVWSARRTPGEHSVASCRAGPAGRISQSVRVAAGMARPTSAMQPDHAGVAPASREYGRVVRVLSVFLVFLHVIVASVGLVLRSAYPTGPKWLEDQLLVRTPLDDSIRDKTLVIVNAPLAFFTTHLYTMRALEGQPVPARIRNLASGMPYVGLKRVDARSLLVRPAGGFLRFLFDRLFRSPLRPLHVGDRIELTGLTVEVTGLTRDGRPAEARFTFDVSLEDDSLAWLYWVDGEFRWWTPPAIGTSIELPCRFPAMN